MMTATALKKFSYDDEHPVESYGHLLELVEEVLKKYRESIG